MHSDPDTGEALSLRPNQRRNACPDVPLRGVRRQYAPQIVWKAAGEPF